MRTQPLVGLRAVNRLVGCLACTTELDVVTQTLEGVAAELFGCTACSILGPQESGCHEWPLYSPEGDLLGFLNLVGGHPRESPELAGMLISLMSIAMSRQARIHQVQRGDRLEREMRLAREVLYDFLPQECWEGGVTLGGWIRPATWVGGDCYDFFSVNDRVGFLLSDACGHGLGATLLAAECRALVRSHFSERDLLSTASRTNVMLYEDTAANRFVTACFGHVSPDSGDVSYVCAGQGPVLHYRAGQEEFEVYGPTGPPLGVLERPGYEVQSLRLSSGDVLVLATDGIYEWRNRVGDFFGEERLKASLRRAMGKSCRDLLRSVKHDLLSFGPDNFDDATILLISRPGSAP